jgi:hypothetical protein
MKGKEVNNGTRFPARIDFCLSCLGDECDPNRCESWNLYIGPAVQVRIGQLASTISFSCAEYVVPGISATVLFSLLPLLYLQRRQVVIIVSE